MRLLSAFAMRIGAAPKPVGTQAARSARVAAVAASLLLFASSIASAVPIGTFSLTINALDAETGAVLGSSSTGTTALAPGWYRTQSVRLDTPPPGFKLYFSAATVRGPGGVIIGTRTNVICSSGDFCRGEVPAPDLVRVDFEASEAYLINQPQRYYEIFLTHATGSISSLVPGGGELLLESGSATRIDQSVINALSPGACASGACEFRFDWTGDGSVSAGMEIRFAPEPGTAILLGLGLSGLAAMRRRC